MRNRFAESLYAVAKKDPRIFIVVADISPAGSMSKFREEYPERFINVGVAEQNMIGVCGGLALRGCIPFAYTIATFTIYRPFEMVRVDLCYQNLPVTVVGIGGGVTYSTLGGTHHAQEDIAVMGAIPNMQVLAPCDPLETDLMTHDCATKPGPKYLRLGKAGEPILTADAIDPYVFGKIRYLKKGSDVCLLSYGPIMKMTFDIAEEIKKTGKSVSIVSVHTLKPLDHQGIAQVLKSHKEVYVIEEHAPHGGLSSHVKEIAWDTGARCKMMSFTLKDEFIHLYGSHQDLLKAHGLDKDIIARRILN